MSARYDIAALGELLIDFTDSGVSDSGMRLFERNPGGAPANVLTAAARFGRRTAFLGKVGDDMHGQFLRQMLLDAGIDVSGLVLAEDVFTTLAFVVLNDRGERSFSFARKPGADTCLRPEELNAAVLDSTRVLHVGSLSLTDEPARSATFAAVERAKAAGAVISYDPNYRASLWADDAAACDQIRSILPIVDIIKLSQEEMPFAAGIDDVDTAIKVLRKEGVALIVITLGEGGAVVATGDQQRSVPAFPCDAVDTTGAGDAFFGGFLSEFVKSGKSVYEVSIDDMVRFARVGCATASLCIGRRGGIPSMPTMEEVTELLNG